MAPLNSRGIFDPRFTAHVAVTSEAGMTSSVLVRRRPVNRPIPEGFGPDPYPFVDIWRGPARVHPKKGDAATSAEFADVATGFQAVTFDLPLIDGEWLIEEGAQRRFDMSDQVVVEANAFPGLDFLKDYVYVVREALGSGYASERHLICDVDLKGGPNRGNPTV